MAAVYKIVSVLANGNLVSSNTAGHKRRQNEFDGVIVLPYSPGEWVAPVVPESRLFAFDSKEAALGWAIGGHPEYQVWEAEAEDVTPATQRLRSCSLFDGENIGNHWKNGVPLPSEEKGFGLPSGVVFCARIKLLRRIDNWR